MSNIFDLNNLDDITDEIKKELKKPKRMNINTIRIFSLFDIKTELSVDEMLVGMLRKYKVNVTKKWINSCLYNLKKRKHIHRVIGKQATYKIGAVKKE